MGYHVLAIDYRGYGDSSILKRPNQTSLVEDGLAAFNWLQKYSHPTASIFIWGHSLGTGVASKLAHDLTHPIGSEILGTSKSLFQLSCLSVHLSVRPTQKDQPRL